MYHTFYRLRGNAFRLTPDHRLSFAHSSYAAALKSIAAAQQQGEGFVVLTGPPGTGKTTLVDELMAQLTPAGIPIAKVSNTQVGSEELLRLLAFAFDINAEGASKAVLLQLLKHYLQERRVDGRSAFLIVDEAQDLDAPALEELRLITNFTIGSEPLVQVLLVGQERLWDRLFCPELEQIHQRIIATCRLKPLTAAQTRRYLAHRLRCAGWAGDPHISGQAIARIHDFTRGIPRRINRVTGRLLEYGADAKLHALDAWHADEVLRQLGEDQLGAHVPLPDPLGLNGPSTTPALRPLGALTAAAMKALEGRTSKKSKTSTEHQTPLLPGGSHVQGDTSRAGSAVPRRLARIPEVALLEASKAWFRRAKRPVRQAAHDQANTRQAQSSTSQSLPQKVSLNALPGTSKIWLNRVTLTLRRLHWRGAVVGGTLVGLTLWATVYPPFGRATLAQAQEQASPSYKSVTGSPARESPRLLPAAAREPSDGPQTITRNAIKSSQAPSSSTTADGGTKTKSLVKADNPTATKPQPVKSDPASAGVSPIPVVDRSNLDHSPLPPLNAGPFLHLEPIAGSAQSPAERQGDFSAYEAQAPVTDMVNRVREQHPEETSAKPAVGDDPKAHSDGTATQTKDLPQGPDESNELLAAAQRALRDYRLTLPPHDNAHIHFRAVLAKDPSNTAAQIGLWQIVRTYQQLARRKIEVDDLDAAGRLVRRGLKVIPNANALLAVARELEELASLNDIVEVEPAERTLSEALEIRVGQ